ncbi:MAG: GtrA family protein [Bacteroidota bacterium]
MEIFAWQFVKFALVGTSGLFIDFGITFFLKEKFSSNKYLANSIGFSFAVISNYFLNKYWTFQDFNPEILFQGLKFVFIAILGLLINNLVIYLLNHHKRLNFYVAKVFAIGIVVLWNFTANYFYTFSG